MSKRIGLIARTTAAHWLFVLIVCMGFTLAYYSIQLGAMVLKFDQLPNYSMVYDWSTNVARIIESTPSLKDTMLIIKDEWVFEMGYMSYEYGMGLSLWSLYLSPVKVLSIMGLGVMLAVLVLLYRLRSDTGGNNASCVIAGGVGATAASFSLMSLSWVVCCATPTWVVGLSILGLGASTALWLEPIGIWLNVFGFAALALMLWLLASNSRNSKNCLNNC